MCDAAFHHRTIRMPQGSTVVWRNDITRKRLTRLYRGFASYEQDECLHITFQMMQPATCAKMCPTTCVVQQHDTSLFAFSMVLAWMDFFRLHVRRNPRVFCCQVNRTSLWNLDLRFCRWLWKSNLQAFSCCFLTDHHGFIVNISFIHFSVEDDSVWN